MLMMLASGAWVGSRPAPDGDAACWSLVASKGLKRPATDANGAFWSFARTKQPRNRRYDAGCVLGKQGRD